MIENASREPSSQIEDETVGHLSGFGWNQLEDKNHLAVNSPHIGAMTTVGEACEITQHAMDGIHDIKPAEWCTNSYPTQDGTFLTEQERMQAHMTYPSYFAENHSWMATKQHMAIPAGYPATVAESQPEILEPTCTTHHNMVQPKLEPYESPMPVSRHTTINLDNLDQPSRVALFNSLCDTKRQVTLVID
jgi:hypothetical protein